MKLVISSEKDISQLNGKWVVQLDTDDNDVDITSIKNWGFYSEKRISLIVGNMFVGLYYCHHKPNDNINSPKGYLDDFINYFNNPNKDNTRFHRLLTTREIDHLCKHFKENII